MAAPAVEPGLEDDGVESARLRVRGTGQADGSGADDHDGVLHGKLLISMTVDALGRSYRPMSMDATIDHYRYDGPMTAVTTNEVGTAASLLSPDVAAEYAEWFGSISDPTRLRLLHAVASSPSGALTVGDLAVRLGISQSTCSHHVRKLSEVGFLVLDHVGRTTMVSVNQSCCTGLPHAADVVMGTMEARPCCPADWPASVTTRAMTDDDLPVVREIYAQGTIATATGSFETETPTVAQLRDTWSAAHRWVAEIDGAVVGLDGHQPGLRPAPATPASARPRCTSPRTSAARAWARR